MAHTAALTDYVERLAAGRVGAEPAAALRPLDTRVQRFIGMGEDEANTFFVAGAGAPVVVWRDAETGWSPLPTTLPPAQAYGYAGGAHEVLAATTGVVRWTLRGAALTSTVLEEASGLPPGGRDGTYSSVQYAVDRPGGAHAAWLVHLRDVTTPMLQYLRPTAFGPAIETAARPPSGTASRGVQLVVTPGGTPHLLIATSSEVYDHLTRVGGVWRIVNAPPLNTPVLNRRVFFAGQDEALYLLENRAPQPPAVLRFTGSAWVEVEVLPIPPLAVVCATADSAGRVRFAVPTPGRLHDVTVYRRD